MSFFKEKSFLPVLGLLMAVVLVSGCIQVGGGEDEEETRYGNGLVIKNFEAFPNEVFSGDTLDLIVDIQNKGGREAGGIWAEVYSLSGLACVNDGCEVKEDISSLDAPTSDFEGETVTETWELEAPSVHKGIADNVNPQVRVYYDYSTVARNSIPVISRQEYKRKLQRDQSLPSAGSTTVSHGPFSVNIKSRSTAVLDEDENTFRVSILANNLLSGTAYTLDGGYEKGTAPKSENDELDKVKVTVTPSGNNKIDCGGTGGFKDSYSSKEDLRGGETLRMNCEVSLDSKSDSMDVPVDVELDYGYFLTDSASLTLKGE